MHGRKRRILGWVGWTGVIGGVVIVLTWIAFGKLTLRHIGESSEIIIAGGRVIASRDLQKRDVPRPTATTWSVSKKWSFTVLMPSGDPGLGRTRMMVLDNPLVILTSDAQAWGIMFAIWSPGALLAAAGAGLLYWGRRTRKTLPADTPTER